MRDTAAISRAHGVRHIILKSILSTSSTIFGVVEILILCCCKSLNFLVVAIIYSLSLYLSLYRIMCADNIPVDRKRPFVRFLIWVYICTDGDESTSEGASLSHDE